MLLPTFISSVDSKISKPKKVVGGKLKLDYFSLSREKSFLFQLLDSYFESSTQNMSYEHGMIGMYVAS